MISRLQVSALLLVAVLAWAGLLLLSGVPVSAAWFSPFSTVVGILVVVLVLADRWLWRINLLRPWLFSTPDLRGTWKADVKPTDPSRPDVAAFMVIRQTLSSISLRLFTSESHSESLSAKVVRCDDGTCTVAGVYRNTPRLEVRAESPVHHGGILLHVHGDAPQSLSGEYWTDRASQGEIHLTARIPQIAASFEEARRICGEGRTIR